MRHLQKDCSLENWEMWMALCCPALLLLTQLRLSMLIYCRRKRNSSVILDQVSYGHRSLQFILIKMGQICVDLLPIQNGTMVVRNCSISANQKNNSITREQLSIIEVSYKLRLTCREVGIETVSFRVCNRPPEFDQSFSDWGVDDWTWL